MAQLAGGDDGKLCPGFGRVGVINRFRLAVGDKCLSEDAGCHCFADRPPP